MNRKNTQSVCKFLLPKKVSKQTPERKHNQDTSGQHAETLAIEYYQSQGFVILEHNYECRYGEIDFIAKKDAQLCFVEVRFRRHHQWGDAISSVDRRKQQKLKHTANAFLQQYPRYAKLAGRFDVVTFQSRLSLDTMNCITNAFD